MSKTKSTTKAAKPSKDVLSKATDAGVAKPGAVDKKSKEVAKQVATKEEKKLKEKKTKKAPTPEPESEDESDSASESESSESESEVETKKPAAPSAAKKSAAAESSDESENDSDDASDDEPAPTAKTNGAKAAAKADSSDESESDSDDEVTPAAVLGTAPAVDQAKDDSSDESEDSESETDGGAEPATKANGTKTKAAESSDEEGSDDDDSNSSENDAEEVEKPAAKVNKRKAEEEAEPTTKKAKTEDAEEGGSKNLFVGNLSWNIDEDWLRSEFEGYGELTGARVMTDKATGRSKGFGYVEFKNAADAAKAHDAMKGYELDGRALNVDFASSKPDNKDKLETRRKSYGDQLSEPSSTLFLGNLSFDAGQEQVSEQFSQFGTILSVRLPTDRETGQPKGYGYVEFETVEYATAALEGMQGAYIGNRPVRVDYSTPRPQNNDGGRGGGFGRGGGRGGGGFNGRGRGRGNDRGGRGGFSRGGGSFGGRGGSRGGRGGSTNRGGFGDFSGRKVSFD